jgi:hypothetical protein
MRQATSGLPVLQCAKTSELDRLNIRSRIPHLTPRLRHGGAHGVTHGAKPREKKGILQHLRSENVSDDEMVGKARDGFLRVGLLRLGHERCARASGRALGSASGYLTGLGVPGVVARARSERGPFANVEETVSSDEEIFRERS